MSELLNILGIIGTTLIGLGSFIFILKAWDRDEMFGFLSLTCMLVIWIICLQVISDLGW